MPEFVRLHRRHQRKLLQPGLGEQRLRCGERILREPAGEQRRQESQSSAVDTADLGTATVAALKGPTAMGMVKMMSDDAASDSPLYDFNIYASADEITPKLVQGELDIAAVPANLASVLYNNTEGQVQVLAINTLGVLYIVEDGDTVQSVEDLKGKTIFASGKGSTRSTP